MCSTSSFLLLSGAAILIFSHLAASLHSEEDTSGGIVASRDDSIVPQSRGKWGPWRNRCRSHGGRCTAEGLCKTLRMKTKCDEKDDIKYMCCAKHKTKTCPVKQNHHCENAGGFCVKKKKACALGQIIRKKCNCKRRKKGHCCVPNCVNGIFTVSGEHFCLLNDSMRNWNDSKDKCETMGMILAEPTDPLAVRLDIIDNYDLGFIYLTWLGARTTGINGTIFTWQSSGIVIPFNFGTLLWYPGDWRIGFRLLTNACVSMMNIDPSEVFDMVHPLFSMECEVPLWTLCQVV